MIQLTYFLQAISNRINIRHCDILFETQIQIHYNVILYDLDLI